MRDSAALRATRERLVARFGAALDPWWARLPATLAELEARWQVELGDPVGRGNTSLVLRCRDAAGRPAVLKLGPDAQLIAAEAGALRRWRPSGRVPDLRAHDAPAGALLLEAIATEIPVAEAAEPVAAADAGALIRALHDCDGPPDADAVPPLSERVDFVFGHWIAQRPQDAGDLRRGHALAAELARSGVGRTVVLHGDLHPANVLDGGAGRGLVAIDPRPCHGDPAFDAIDWVGRGPDADDRCATLAAALDADPARLRAWCEAFGVPRR